MENHNNDPWESSLKIFLDYCFPVSVCDCGTQCCHIRFNGKNYKQTMMTTSMGKKKPKSFIHPTLFNSGSERKLELFPAGGYTLDRSPVHHRDKQTKQSCMYTLTPRVNLASLFSLTCLFLDCERKLEHPGRTRTRTARAFKLHRKAEIWIRNLLVVRRQHHKPIWSVMCITSLFLSARIAGSNCYCIILI